MAKHTEHPRRTELERQVRDGEIDTLIVALTDMQGRLMGKRVQGEAFLNGAIDHGAHFCTYLLGTDMEMNTPDGFALMNWETGYGDWIADPVWDTLRTVPWLAKSAIVLSDTVDHHGAEIPVSPRTMLKRQVEKAAAMGFSVMAGSEFEYYLLTDTYEGAYRKGFTGLERFGYYNEDYHLLQGTKGEPIHGRLRNLMTAARIPVEFSKGEAAPGQHEVNIHYSDVLEMADQSVLFKHGAKEIAGLHIENRFPGGDMNPYLAYAAVIGAGLLGVDRKIEPPDEYLGNGYLATGCDRMPRALYDAIRELEASKAAVDIFGADVVAHYLNAARVEQETYDAIVHPWDRERYLERG